MVYQFLYSIAQRFELRETLPCQAECDVNELINNRAVTQSSLFSRHDLTSRAGIPRARLKPGTPQNRTSTDGAGCETPAADFVVNSGRGPITEFGVVVLESHHATGFGLSVRRRHFSEFLLVVAGQARLEGGGGVFQLAPGSLVHTPANCDYHFQDNPGQAVTLYAIQYRDKILPARVARQLAALGILHWNVHRACSPLLRALPSICKEMLWEQSHRPIGWETALIARLCELTVHVMRLDARRMPHCAPDAEKSSDSIARVSHYAARLESEFFLPTSLNEAARSTGLSRRRFTQLFRSITGQSWHKYLLGLRLHHARQLLSATDEMILSVALESGFDDLSNFNHVFRQAVGCSPSEFRTRRTEPRRPLAASSAPFGKQVSLDGAAFMAVNAPGCWTASQLGWRASMLPQNQSRTRPHGSEELWEIELPQRPPAARALH